MPELSGARPELTWTTSVTQWHFSLGATLVVLGLAALYAWGVVRARRGEGWPAGSAALFALGLLTVLVSTESSIGVYELDLFWVHMVRHLLLIMVAPALLVAGRPITLLMRAGGARTRAAVPRVLKSPPVALLTHPVVASLIYAAAVVVTHLTGVMDTVMRSPTASGVEALVYVVAGYLYFLPVFGDEPIRWWLSYPMRMLLVLLSMPVDTFTGIALMQTDQPTAGMSARAISDGGAVMWVGGDFIMLVAILLVFRVWMQSTSTRTGWMDAARTQTLRERIGVPGEGPAGAAVDAGLEPGRGAMDAALDPAIEGAADIDNDDAQLQAYNAWLARMNERESPPGR